MPIRRGARIALAGVGAFGAVVAARHISEAQLRKRKWAIPTNIPASEIPTQTDVLIVGTGAAGLSAALRCKALGMNTVIIEKNPKIGGTTSYSGGVCWIPNSGLHQGVEDSKEEALTYLNSIIGDVGPASSPERKNAFLDNGPEMVKFLVSEGLRWRAWAHYPDYFPENPGGKDGGRTIEPAMFNRNELGEWKPLLDISPVRAPIPVYTSEANRLVRAKMSWDGWMVAMRVLTFRTTWQWLMGRDAATLGQSLIGQLIVLNLNKGTPIIRETRLKDLLIEDGKITGALVEKDGKEVTIKTPNVILAAGGFSRNKELRPKFQGIPTDWTNSNPGDTGDALSIALKHNIATAMLEGGWWGVTLKDPSNGQNYWSLFERGLPHSMIVDRDGKRFTNEAKSYNAIGLDMLAKHKEDQSRPSALILDSNHRNRYMLTTKYLPGFTPQSAIDSGFIFKADTLEDLAKQMDIDPAGLEKTVERFNGFVETGKDLDFNRGYSKYDQHFGDTGSAYAKNVNLGTIAKAPFYGVKAWPGDLGTKGGVLTDEKARALTSSGKVLEGLYAVGNSSASVMGHTYPGAGGTLGPAVTFGFIAATDASTRAKA